MRPPVPLEIPAQLVELATLYAPSRDPLQAVSHVLQDYPNVVGDLRRCAAGFFSWMRKARCSMSALKRCR